VSADRAQVRGRRFVPFVARVLVVGDAADPEAVVPAWELERDHDVA
jgi:hypothetical protein